MLLLSRAADGNTNASAMLSVASSAFGIKLLDALHKLMMHALQISGGAREVRSKAVLMMAVDGASPAGFPTAVLPESCNTYIWSHHAAKAYSGNESVFVRAFLLTIISWILIGHGRKVDKKSAKVLRAVTADNAAADIDGHGDLDSGPVGGGVAREATSAGTPVTNIPR